MRVFLKIGKDITEIKDWREKPFLADINIKESVQKIIARLFYMDTVKIANPAFLYVAIVDENGSVVIEERLETEYWKPGKIIANIGSMENVAQNEIANFVIKGINGYWRRMLERASKEAIIRMSD